MKGAIGNAMVMNIVITFIILTTMFLIGSISYTKAFKTKTKIIDIIEKYDGDFNRLVPDTKNNTSMIMNDIESFLGEIGYRTSSTNSCGVAVAESSNYDVCIYEHNSSGITYRDSYYEVVVYMYFDVPIIGDTLKIPVRGQTKTMFKDLSDFSIET